MKRYINKRTFLKLLALTLPTIASGAALSDADRKKLPTGKRKVVVVGAGISGLAAARELQRHDHEVIVLEARERTGGRIWTSRTWKDMPLDLGATWIHGVKGNPITELADEMRIRRLVTSYEKYAIYSTQGERLTKTGENRLSLLREKVQHMLKRAGNADEDVSIREAIDPLIKEFPADSEAVRFINFIVNSYFEHEYAGSASELSAHWYDSDKEFAGDDAFFADGYDVITEFLAKDLRVELSTPVKSIDWQTPQVFVRTDRGDFEADHVVVTVPLGVLKNETIQFAPLLPERKRKAIKSLGMGVLNKCYLLFPEVFWPEDVDWLEHIPEHHGVWTEWVSFKRTANRPVLMGFNAADRGREIEAWTDQQIVDSAMKTLRTIFGSNIPGPIDYQITRWASDPFARGSYSFNALGSTPTSREDLAEPLGGKIFFAGEATSTNYFGTVHGAYLSGLRAARDVLS